MFSSCYPDYDLPDPCDGCDEDSDTCECDPTECAVCMVENYLDACRESRE